MFVVDAGRGGSEFPEIIRHIANLLERVDAQILRIEKWDERKLAYRIKRAKRGIYILVYFRAEGSAVAGLRHDVQLSEQLLRVLVLRADEEEPVTGELYSPEGELIPEPDESAPEEQPEAAEPETEEEQAEEEEEEAAEAEAETVEEGT
jgi:ribosomal protein S6